MKIIVAFLITLLALININGQSVDNIKENVEMKNQERNDTICKRFDCFERNKNKEIVLEGQFRKYTPNTRGKGANHMFWDWEVLLDDGIAIPAVCYKEEVDLSLFENKIVVIDCLAFYGIVIGSPNPEEQSATGYRIDINSIREK